MIDEAGDEWIDALPDDLIYGPCPCCGKAIKFIKDDTESHYDTWIKNYSREGDR